MRMLPFVLLAICPLAFAIGTGGVPGDTAGSSDPAAPFDAAAARTGEKVHPGSSFDMLDRDKDGRISASELKAAQGARIDFERADTNGDGYLSPDEYKRAASATGSAAGDAPASQGTESSGR